MRSFKNIAFGLIGAAAVASASDVHDLKADTFPDFIKENPLVLAECTSLALPLTSFPSCRALTNT
jgi:protein disulfide-isomerase A1